MGSTICNLGVSMGPGTRNGGSPSSDSLFMCDSATSEKWGFPAFCPNEAVVNAM